MRKQKNKKIHVPVLLGHVLKRVKKKNKSSVFFVDCTLGDGGHSVKLLKEIPGTQVLSLDWDIHSIDFIANFYKDLEFNLFEFNVGNGKLTGLNQIAENRNWNIVKSNFVFIDKIVQLLSKSGIVPERPDFILLDLGISSRQLAEKERGFSFMGEGVADMRMDATLKNVKASDLLNVLSRRQLRNLFVKTVGMNKTTALRLAEKIEDARLKRKFGNENDIKRLKHIAYEIMPIRSGATGRLHPATLLFLALRIAVNTELQNLLDVLPIAYSLLDTGGELLVIGYHSSEFDIIERFVEEKNLNAELIKPSNTEITINPRARSAKLFVIKKHAS